VQGILQRAQRNSKHLTNNQLICCDEVE